MSAAFIGVGTVCIRILKIGFTYLYPFSWKVSELIINGLQRKDDGLYECQARNEGGQFFKSGHIQVSSPRFLQFQGFGFICFVNTFHIDIRGNKIDLEL